MRLAVSCRQDQLGGPQIMVPNGVTHQAGEPNHPFTSHDTGASRWQVVRDDQEARCGTWPMNRLFIFIYNDLL